MTNDIRIERITENDSIAIRAMDFETPKQEAWVLEVFNEYVNDPYGYFFKAYLGDELAGYCSAYHNTMHEHHFCKIMDLWVKQAFRRKGIAKELMLKMLDLAKELGLDRAKLEVDTRNNAAIKLYKDLGFQIEGTEEGFYDDGAAAYIMWRYESNR